MSGLIFQRGNALFLILIAVALFAALSYVVTQSGRSNGDARKEQTAIIAAQMVQYAADIQQSIIRLRLSGVCSESTVNMSGSPPEGYADNPLAPLDKSCNLFDPAGGGLPAINFDASAFVTVPTNANWASYLYDYDVGYASFNAQNSVQGVGTTGGASDSSADLLFQIFPLTTAVCVEINKNMGVNPPTFAAPVGGIWMAEGFKGVYKDNATIGMFNSRSAGGCYYDSFYGMNVYIQPVIGR